MNPIRQSFLRIIPALAVGFALVSGGLVRAEEGEILTRGPVHEAFAATVAFDPEAGTIVSKAPPEMIEELPPDQRPEGDNVAWIPGYWAWDDERDDFLWISGIWRNLPPEREWVPGYWASLGVNFQWTSGYWEDSETTEVTYLPKPPKSQERGPNIAAASNGDTWVPGNWVWQGESYAWRPGYWAPAREEWTWTPAYYRWTSRGYTYVDGYWDYPVERRGVAFAPVYFERETISTSGFHYSPSTAIALTVFVNHLFIRPSHNHYYFGDYYEPTYRDRGYYASYDYYHRHRGYDPIFARQRWEHRADDRWERGRREYFEQRRDNRDSRPPRTWRELASRSQEDRDRDRKRGDFDVADRFDRIAENRENGRQRFQKVSSDDRARFVSQRQDIRKFGNERARVESRKDGARSDDSKQPRASREKITRSPVIGRKSDRAPERLQPRATDRKQVAGRGPSPASNEKRGNDGKPDRMTERREDDRSKANSERRTVPGQKRETTSKPPARPNSGREEGNRGGNPRDGKMPAPTGGEKIKPQPTPSRANPKPSEGRKLTPAPETVKKPNAAPAPNRDQPGRTETKKEQPSRSEGSKPTQQPNRGNDTPKQQPQPRPQQQPKQQPQPRPQQQPKQQAQPRPQQQPKQQAQPRPQQQPKQQAQPRPQQQPKQQAQPRPQQQPKQQAQPRPQQQPRQQAQPRPQPQPKQQAQPRAQNQPNREAPRNARSEESRGSRERQDRKKD